MKPFARRGLNLPANLIAAATKRGNELRQEGLDVIFLTQGQPDFPTPEHIVTAAFAALQKGYTKYVPNQGIPELRKAVAEKLTKTHNVNYNPEDVIITNGGALGIFLTNMALVEPGAEVIALEPYFGTYAKSVALTQGNFVSIPMTVEKGRFALNPQLLERAITEKTRLIILNSPCNPTGSMFTREELETIAEIVLKYDLWVLSDEVYEAIVYDDNKHISIVSIAPELAQRTIIVNSFSKTYSMTGWRLGYLAVKNARLLKIMSEVYHLSARCATSFVQHAGLAALTGPQDSVRNMVAEYTRRRNYIVDRLNAIRGLNCIKPQGAFYVFVDFSPYAMDSLTFCNRLLDEALVAVTPGKYFGPNCDHYFRLSFATSLSALEEGVTRIKRTLESW